MGVDAMRAGGNVEALIGLIGFLIGIILLLALIFWVDWASRDLQAEPPAPPFRETRVRYPNEEAIAKKACADRRLMYWWIADPRKASATMTVRCTGQITKTVEVKF